MRLNMIDLLDRMKFERCLRSLSLLLLLVEIVLVLLRVGATYLQKAADDVTQKTHVEMSTLR